MISVYALRCIQVPPQRVGKHNIVSIMAVISAGNTGYITSVVVVETFIALRGEKEQKLDRIRRCSSTWPFPRSPW